MTRNVMLARWSEVGTDYGCGLLRFEIRANAFCHQMVRAIVGTMVDAGAGRLQPARFADLAGQGPPVCRTGCASSGLCLWEVGYD